MIANVSPPTPSLTGIRKAAMLMVLIGEDTGAAILKEFSEDEVQLISREIARVAQITSEQADVVLEEFHQMAMARDFIVKGGLDYAKKMLLNAFGSDTSKRLVDRVVKALGHDLASFDALHKADPQQLAKFIHNEHPQTIALILSHLRTAQAAALLTSLPPEIRADVAQRMANLDQITPEVINKIAAVIGRKLQTFGGSNRESYGGVHAVSEMFNRLDSGSSKEILDVIHRQNPALVERIRQLMFVFEDLLLITLDGMKEVTNRIDRKVLTVALKGTSERLRNHFFQCLSTRGADMMREDIETMGPVKIKDVEAAQQSIIALVRKLETEGVISLKGSASEQYVV